MQVEFEIVLLFSSRLLLLSAWSHLPRCCLPIIDIVDCQAREQYLEFASKFKFVFSECLDEGPGCSS